MCVLSRVLSFFKFGGGKMYFYHNTTAPFDNPFITWLILESQSEKPNSAISTFFATSKEPHFFMAKFYSKFTLLKIFQKVTATIPLNRLNCEKCSAFGKFFEIVFLLANFYKIRVRHVELHFSCVGRHCCRLAYVFGLRV